MSKSISIRKGGIADGGDGQKSEPARSLSVCGVGTLGQALTGLLCSSGVAGKTSSGRGNDGQQKRRASCLCASRSAISAVLARPSASASGSVGPSSQSGCQQCARSWPPGRPGAKQSMSGSMSCEPSGSNSSMTSVWLPGVLIEKGSPRRDFGASCGGEDARGALHIPSAFSPPVKTSKAALERRAG
eukprot:CAMPEP_0197650114 /NCGR_PEP_ID=MMETSP1338-20131121/30755_1 /TAXON_ID=43686 ORGANISM="Pelagodinium beii, Strain RCC1491" /NCGR_SAMPLE_ID=MMETSP1338 /ASSEMBLY_ACC=CAM_ASM_000754 /LENGTH=186 /DNA_ID=CAMNT_0043224465 /DNA_START=140 /DNA_END=700 /DNA_ORIENTATION=-